MAQDPRTRRPGAVMTCWLHHHGGGMAITSIMFIDHPALFINIRTPRSGRLTSRAARIFTQSSTPAGSDTATSRSWLLSAQVSRLGMCRASIVSSSRACRPLGHGRPLRSLHRAHRASLVSARSSRTRPRRRKISRSTAAYIPACGGASARGIRPTTSCCAHYLHQRELGVDLICPEILTCFSARPVLRARRARIVVSVGIDPVARRGLSAGASISS